jgi:hypothetical protein
MAMEDQITPEEYDLLLAGLQNIHVRMRQKKLGGDWTGHEEEWQRAKDEIQPLLQELDGLSDKIRRLKQGAEAAEEVGK